MAREAGSDAISVPKSAIRTVLLAIVAVIVLAFLIFLGTALVKSVSGSSFPSSVDGNTSQAVFLSNGQIFFGKLSSGNDTYYELRHVYLLQSSVTSRGRPAAQQLIKLTKEIHGPQDLMMIDRHQILYIENLDPHGQAAKLIGTSGG
jgi:hypothetical protein